MAFQVKVEYGGQCFATFLLENESYDGLVSSIRRNCSYLAQLDADEIRLYYRDEDGDMVNVFCVLGNALHSKRSERPRLQENIHSS